MAYNVYKARGNKDYKTKKKIKELEKAITEKYKSDSNFKFDPATTKEELDGLHKLYCSEEVSFEEIKDNKPELDKKPKAEVKEDIDEINTEDIEEEKTESSDRDFVDPFNRDEPKVREYVLTNGYDSDKKDNEKIIQTFDEPTSEKEAFVYGDGIEEAEEVKDNESSDKNTKEKTKPTKQESLNPSFDTMSNAKQKRSTKRFAKNIVNAVVSLSEKGFVWFANKEISEAKIVEYEMTGEIDLGILLDLGDGQEATVKQFFANQRVQAEHLSKIDDEIKEDLVSALTEVMLEKGIAPTPIQELAIVGLNMFGSQAVVLMGISAQNKSVLSQLKVMQEGKSPADNSHVPPVEEPVKEKPAKETKEDTTEDETFEDVFEVDQTKLIGETVETKE